MLFGNKVVLVCLSVQEIMNSGLEALMKIVEGKELRGSRKKIEFMILQF